MAWFLFAEPDPSQRVEVGVVDGLRDVDEATRKSRFAHVRCLDQDHPDGHSHGPDEALLEGRRGREGGRYQDPPRVHRDDSVQQPDVPDRRHRLEQEAER